MTTRDLVAESNRIEGITREPAEAEVLQFAAFLNLDRVTVATLENFVTITEPGAALRDKKGMDVYVGDHHPKPGGPRMRDALEMILEDAQGGRYTPHDVHVAYEKLHPFVDCNGRSGRVLWHWMMRKQGNSMAKKLGFLHTFYYQALSAAR